MIAFDTETTNLIRVGVTDLSMQPRIIELAMVSFDPALKRDPSEWARFSTFINPGVPITAEITKITGITDADVTGAPEFCEVLPDLIQFVRADRDNHWLGHNLGFDMDMLIFELRRIGWEHRFPYPQHQTDTIPLCGGLKLDTWSKNVLGEAYVKQTHRALDDVHRLITCYQSLNGD